MGAPTIEQNLTTIAETLVRIAIAIETYAESKPSLKEEPIKKSTAKKPAAKKPAAKKPAAKKPAAKKSKPVEIEDDLIGDEDENENDSEDEELGSLFDGDDDTPDDATIEDVRGACKPILNEYGKEALNALLSRFGVTKVSQLGEEQYSDVVALAERAIEEGEDIVYDSDV